LAKKILCVEFIGVWGSGKTTIVRKVTKNLKENNIVVMSYDDFVSLARFQRYSKVLLLVLTKPITVIKFLSIMIKIFFKFKPIDKFQSEIFFTLIKVSLAKHILLKNKPEVLLWEGDYHLLTMFKNMKKLSKKDLLLLSGTNNSHCSLPIFIDVNTSLAKKRVIQDQSTGIFRFSNEDIKMLGMRYKYMVQNQKYLNQIFNKEGIHHVLAQGINDIDENCDDIEILIHRIRYCL
jgi:hypothetical protein